MPIFWPKPVFSIFLLSSFRKNPTKIAIFLGVQNWQSLSYCPKGALKTKLAKNPLSFLQVQVITLGLNWIKSIKSLKSTNKRIINENRSSVLSHIHMCTRKHSDPAYNLQRELNGAFSMRQNAIPKMSTYTC